MNEDSFKIGIPGFSIGFKKTDSCIKLNEDETILLRYWSWRRFGYVRKALKLKDGMVHVQRLD